MTEALHRFVDDAPWPWYLAVSAFGGMTFGGIVWIIGEALANRTQHRRQQAHDTMWRLYGAWL